MPSRLQRPKPTDPAPRGPLTPAHVACEYRIAAWRDSKLPISAVIQWQTRSAYHHVGLVRPDQSIVEATWPRVTDQNRLHPADDHVDLFTFRKWTGWSLVHWEALDEWMSDRIGAPYDAGGALGFLLKWREKADKRWFCSELLGEGVLVVCRKYKLPFPGLQARIASQYIDPYDCVKSLAVEPFLP